MKRPKNFYLTVSLPVEHAKAYEEAAKKKGLSLNRYIASLVDEGREAAIRAREAQAKIAEVENAAFSHLKVTHRLLGVMFRALRETMPSARKVRFDLLWNELTYASPGDQYEAVRDKVIQFVQIPVAPVVEVPENEWIN